MLSFFRAGETAPPSASISENGQVDRTKLSDNKGHVRDVLFYVPHTARTSSIKPRLLLALHGSLLTGSIFREHYTTHAYDALALNNNYIVAYPDAYKGAWNAAWIEKPVESTREGVDDIEFIRDVIKSASDRYGTAPVAAREALGVGFSNGGAMLLHCALSSETSMFAAIAVHGITVPAPQNYAATVAKSTMQNLCPVAFVHGMADRTVPSTGGPTAILRIPGLPPFMSRGSVRSLHESAELFASRFRDAGISLRRSQEDVEPMNHVGVRTQFSGTWKGKERALVEVTELEGEGHNVSLPGANRVPGLMGPQRGAYHSPKRVVQFFNQFEV